MPIEALMYSIKKWKVTYAKLHNAMAILGFSSGVEKSKDEIKEMILGKPRYFICYYDRQGKRFYGVIVSPDDALVSKYDLFHISRQLYEFGYTKDYEALGKQIEKNRLPLKVAA